MDEVLEALDDEVAASDKIPRRRFRSKVLQKEGWAARPQRVMEQQNWKPKEA